MKTTNNLLVTGVLVLAMLPAFISAQQVNVNINEKPFSCRGSYLAFLRFNGRGNPPKQLDLHSVTRRGPVMDIYNVEVLHEGKVVQPEHQANEKLLTLQHENGKVEICFENARTIRYRGQGLHLRLSLNDQCWLVPFNEGQYRVMHEGPERFMMTVKSGTFKLDTAGIGRMNAVPNFAIELFPGKDGYFELVMEEYTSEWVPKVYEKPFDECWKGQAASLHDWISKAPEVMDGHQDAINQALYVNWSSLVEPRGNVLREGMLMGKTWMTGIWSWDHCFNAMAMSHYDMEVAWNQLMVIFDHQNELGALPDDIYEHRVDRGHVKSPIHGWALRYMMQNGHVTREMLTEIYQPLVKWTKFWLHYRDDDKNGVVQINHWNDNFDKTTVYDMGIPVEDPATNAYLALQMDVLAEVADILEKPEEAVKWRQESTALVERLVERCWDGEKFIFQVSGTNNYNKKSINILQYTPLILGKKLPGDIRDKMIADLKTDNGIVTPYGMATESIYSELFDSASYTRGPVWAPLNIFVIDGLYNAGEPEFAKELAKRFCNLCKNGEFAENFNPLTGQPGRDPAYTWTSSVYLVLMHQFFKKE